MATIGIQRIQKKTTIKARTTECEAMSTDTSSVDVLAFHGKYSKLLKLGIHCIAMLDTMRVKRTKGAKYLIQN